MADNNYRCQFENKMSEIKDVAKLIIDLYGPEVVDPEYALFLLKEFKGWHNIAADLHFRQHNTLRPSVGFTDRSSDKKISIGCAKWSFANGTHRPRCLPCGHLFGHHCIARWIATAEKQYCPNCRIPCEQSSLVDIISPQLRRFVCDEPLIKCQHYTMVGDALMVIKDMIYIAEFHGPTDLKAKSLNLKQQQIYDLDQIDPIGEDGDLVCTLCATKANNNKLHSLYCLPCGHVIGESCLDEHQYLTKSAKCPIEECRMRFYDSQNRRLFLTEISEGDVGESINGINYLAAS